jgi:hypothetical protein
MLRNMTLVRQLAVWSCLAAWNPSRIGIEISMTSASGFSVRTGIDGLLAVFHGANNLELLAECLPNYCDHLLMIISEHHTNLGHGTPFGNVEHEIKGTHHEIVLLADP